MRKKNIALQKGDNAE